MNDQSGAGDEHRRDPALVGSADTGVDIEVTIAVQAGSEEGIIDRLRAAGLNNIEDMVELGAVAGSAPASALGAIRDVRGVAAVEPAHGFQLPDPDDDLQ